MGSQCILWAGSANSTPVAGSPQVSSLRAGSGRTSEDLEGKLGLLQAAHAAQCLAHQQPHRQRKLAQRLVAPLPPLHTPLQPARQTGGAEPS